MTNRRLEKSLRQAKNKKQDLVTPIDGILGIPLNGSKVVEVPNREGFVFVRLRGNQSELIQAYNAATSPVYDLPVLVIRQTGVYKVIGRNEVRNQNQWGLAPYLPKHGAQHSFNPSLNIGGDVVWTYSQQFMPLLAYPSGTAGSPRLSVSPYVIRDLNGNWVYAGNTGTISTIPYNPNTGSRAIMALVYIDSVSGNPYLLVNSGTPIDISLTGTSQVVPYIPRTTSPSQIPIAAIRLLSGTSSLTWDNVYDVRPFFQVIPSGTSSSGGGGGVAGLGFVGWDEGVYQATGTVLNVTGPRATLSASGTVLNLLISPDPQELIGVYGLNNGIALGTGTWIDFGDNLSTSISGTVLRVNGSAGGGGGSILGVMAQDEGVPLGTGTIFNFVGAGVTASISGSVINVNVPLGGLVSDKKVLTSGDKTITSTSFADIDSNLNITLTTGARRCLCVFTAYGKCTTNGLQVDVDIDGTRAGGAFGLTGLYALSNNANLSYSYLTDVLSAGSHTFKPRVRVDGGSATLYASSGITPIVFSVHEIP